MIRKSAALLPLLAAIALPLGSFASAQDAADVATRPVQDLGMKNAKIPAVLTAIDNPYATAGTGSCGAIRHGLAELDGAIGPDFDAGRTPKKHTVGALAMAGVDAVIPFGGLVREVSGANAADRRKASAVALGIARRGYLRGLQSARHCR